MSSAPQLFLSDDGDEYFVHPVVVFTILDAFKRRPLQKDPNDESKFVETRVIGTLLGEREDKKVYIRECFPVPHVETEDSVTLDVPFHESMLALMQRVNSKLTVVGWFATGQNKHSILTHLIHSEYTEQCAKLGRLPVLLMVNTSLKNSRLGIHAYRGKLIRTRPKDPKESAVQLRFDQAPLELFALESEKIGMDALINDNPESDQLDAPASINTDRQAVHVALQRLQEELESVSKYLTAVTSGHIKGNPEVGRQIAGALAQVPAIDSAGFDQAFGARLEDTLLVHHLAAISARSQLDLSDRINSLQ